jgi:hypothetical protein
VAVKGLTKPGQQQQQVVDQTRNGVARGVVVVPEFPAGTLMAVSGVIGVILLVQRFARGRISASSGKGLK